MRLRFMDMEPDEIFANAKQGDQRCADFVKRWHRALAAGTATAIHLEGPGRFYFTGLNIGASYPHEVADRRVESFGESSSSRS